MKKTAKTKTANMKSSKLKKTKMDDGVNAKLYERFSMGWTSTRRRIMVAESGMEFLLFFPLPRSTARA